MIYCAVIDSPLGKLGIKTGNQSLESIDFLPIATPLFPPKCEFSSTVATQLEQYFNRPSHQFIIPFNLQGTEFQQKVWNALLAIPTGKTQSYGDLAKRLNSSARAIGNACRRNPIPVIIPCHRIVGQKGLGGYSGAIDGSMMQIKTWLLNHEKLSA